ncbi:MAG: hypothetical protein O7F73_00065 [Gammaproteobacteria bacterium]|nr:hypothetical protein [Gammaproteobacteria bacterium]
MITTVGVVRSFRIPGGDLKTFQKVFALGLLFIAGSGLWLGLSASGLRRRILITSLLAGTALFLALVLGGEFGFTQPPIHSYYCQRLYRSAGLTVRGSQHAL